MVGDFERFDTNRNDARSERIATGSGMQNSGSIPVGSAAESIPANREGQHTAPLSQPVRGLRNADRRDGEVLDDT